jgi:quercetin dioxygenase-like cupin family protein
MKTAKLHQMKKGWFVGDFSPSILRSKHVEVAVKHYKAGDREQLHKHEISTEITAIIQGSVKMSGKEYAAGDIVMLNPGEATDFEALTDAISVVVKTPSAVDDKYVL